MCERLAQRLEDEIQDYESAALCFMCSANGKWAAGDVRGTRQHVVSASCVLLLSLGLVLNPMTHRVMCILRQRHAVQYYVSSSHSVLTPHFPVQCHSSDTHPFSLPSTHNIQCFEPSVTGPSYSMLPTKSSDALTQRCVKQLLDIELC